MHLLPQLPLELNLQLLLRLKQEAVMCSKTTEPQHLLSALIEVFPLHPVLLKFLATNAVICKQLGSLSEVKQIVSYQL